MRPSLDLWQKEVASYLRRGRPLERNAGILNSGHYFSKPDVSLGKIREDCLAATKLAIAEKARSEGLSEQERRSYQSKLIIRGKLTDSAIAIIKELGIIESSSDISAILVKSIGRDKFYDWLQGRLSDAIISDLFIDGIFDLSFLIGWSVDSEVGASFLRDWIRDPGRTIAQSISQLQMQLQKVQNDNDLINQHVRKEIIATNRDWIEWRKIFVDIVTSPKIREGYLEKILSIENKKILYNSDIMSLPSIDTISLLISTYYDRVLRARTNRRSPQESDLGDLLHLSYAPYVDVIRADRHAADVFLAAKIPSDVVIVSRIDDLINSIDLRMSRKN